MTDTNPLKELAKIAPETPISAPTGIAAIALQMAMQYHDMGMIKDGVLYQQYKMEGRNVATLTVVDVFETAMQIESHLLRADDRIAQMLLDALNAEDDGIALDQQAGGRSQDVTDTKDAWETCSHRGECINGGKYGKGCHEDQLQSANGGKPWHECSCGIDADGGIPTDTKLEVK